MNVLLRILNVVGFAAVIIANYIAQTRGIVGQTTGEISAKYPTIITPAGYAFSIWLLIYAGLACYVVYSLTASGRKEKLVQSVGTYFFISCLLNIGWLILWQMEAIVSSTFMLYALLLCLLVININLTRVVPAPERAATRWFVILPFNIYLAWVSLASLVNTAVALTYTDWQPLSTQALAIVLLSAAVMLAYLLGFGFRSVVMMLVFVWGLVAIAVEQRDQVWIAGLALAAAIIVSIGVVVLALRLYKKHRPAAHI